MATTAHSPSIREIYSRDPFYEAKILKIVMHGSPEQIHHSLDIPECDQNSDVPCCRYNETAGDKKYCDDCPNFVYQHNGSRKNVKLDEEWEFITTIRMALRAKPKIRELETTTVLATA